jgi:hypothetical protein
MLNIGQSSMNNHYGSANINMGKFSNDGAYAVTNIGLQDLYKVNNYHGHRDITLD